MNIFALVILLAVIIFLGFQVKAFIQSIKQRIKNKKDKNKQVNNNSEIKGDEVVNDRN